MKKLTLTLAIVLGLSLTTFADGGGLFQRGDENQETGGFMNRSGDFKAPILPGHGGNGDADGNETPLGGALMLIGFGAAYALKKKNEK